MIDFEYLIILLVLVTLIALFSRFISQYENSYLNGNSNSIFLANIHSFGFNKKKCSDTVVICMKNRDCYNYCQPSNDLTYNFNCERGVCKAIQKKTFVTQKLAGSSFTLASVENVSLISESSSSIPDSSTKDKVNLCDVNHGLFYVLHGITQFSTTMWHCVSIYKDLWSNTNTIVPGVCAGGQLYTNVFDHAPLLQDCKCPDGFKLYGSGMTHSVEQIETPKCIKPSLSHLYSGYYRDI